MLLIDSHSWGETEDLEKKINHSSVIISIFYLAFFHSFTFAHRARCAAAIFLRADADMVRFTGVEPVVFAAAGCDPFRGPVIVQVRVIRVRLRCDQPP